MPIRRVSQSQRYPQIGVVTPDAAIVRRVGDAIERLFGHREAMVADRIDGLLSGRGAFPAGKDLDLLILDPGRASEIEAVLKALASRWHDLPVLVLLREPAREVVAALIDRGALDVLLIDEPGWTVGLASTIEKSLARAERRRQRDRSELELRRALAQLETRNRALEESVSRLETMAWTDALTGLANRRQVEERLPQLFAEAARYGSDLSCLMIDLDGLKPVNDNYGHAAGDDLLQLAARIVTDQVRASDIAGRVGGDEFVVLMPRTSDAVAAAVARRLADTFAQRGWRLIEREYGIKPACAERIGMSIGVASLQGSQPLDGETLLACADSAVYEAKRRGKNHVVVHRVNGRFDEAAPITP